MTREEAIKEIKAWDFLYNDEKEVIETLIPELAESEDEKIRKALIDFFSEPGRKEYILKGFTVDDILAWLEKQKDTNVLIQEASEKAYTEGMRVERKHWLEKQGAITKLSEEEQNKFAKGVLTSCASSFIDYLDAHKYEGKMCVSNGECEDIENAFHNAMWDRLYRYYCKYIEKQGEQKPVIEMKSAEESLSIDSDTYNKIVDECIYGDADKVEPKFHEGEWITNGDYTWKIVEVKPLDYILQSQDGNTVDDTISHVDEQFHSFTIQDARDGDVFCTYECDKPKIVFILKGTPKRHYALSYHCYYNIMYPHFDSDSEKGCLAPNDEDVKPATKEQRDALMKAMTDAGYTFDFEKKELKKIHVIDEGKAEIYDQFTPFEEKLCALTHACQILGDEGKIKFIKKHSQEILDIAKKQIEIEQKHAWSEEDKNFMYDTLSNLTELKDRYGEGYGNVGKCIDWLKSLKQRIGG